MGVFKFRGGGGYYYLRFLALEMLQFENQLEFLFLVLSLQNGKAIQVRGLVDSEYLGKGNRGEF